MRRARKLILQTQWAQDGTVLVSTTELTIEKGKSGRYGVTLSKAPYDYDYQEEGGWWLMMVVDGMRRHTDLDRKIRLQGLDVGPVGRLGVRSRRLVRRELRSERSLSIHHN